MSREPEQDLGAWRRIRRVFRLPASKLRMETELDDELHFHLDGCVEELMERERLTRTDAEREARRRFGDYDAYRSEARDIDDETMRDNRRMDLMDTVVRESRQALRVLARTRTFSLIAVATLALGIGAATAIYTVLDAVVLRPLPYRHSEQLVSVLHPATVPGNGESKWGMSSGGYFYFKNNNRTLEDLGGYRTGTTTVLNDAGAEEVREAQVTASIFTTLQARAALGRLIGPDDDRPRSPATVVLSHEFWRRHFGGDRAVVGKMLHTDGGPVQIIGVAEPGLSLPKPGPFASTTDLASFGVDLWTPLRLDPQGPFYNSHQYSGIGRLRAGVTADAAQRELATLMQRFPEQMPAAYSAEFFRQFNFRVAVRPLAAEVLGPTLARSLWLLFGAVAVVLFIACANVANLFLVRMEARRRESAVRTALGADRVHMAVHFLAESLWITGAAAVAGIFLAWLGLHLIVALAPTDIPRLSTVALSGTSIGFAVILAVAAGVVFGVLPLARTAVDVATLREGARGLTASLGQRAVRNGLVAGQVALALVLLAAAGLMLRSFDHLRNVKPGLDPRGVLTFSTAVPFTDFKSARAVTEFQREFQRRVAGLPGVEQVGAVDALPLQDYGSGCSSVQSQRTTQAGQVRGGCVSTPAALPGFFEALGVQVRGRVPAWSDVDASDSTATVAVVTQALANRLWPQEDAIGKGIAVGGRHDMRQYFRVIGVIPELRAHGLDQAATEAVFTPTASSGETWTVKTAAADPMSQLPAIRRVLTELNPHVAIVNPRTMTEVVSRSVARASFVMTLLAIAGTMALLLSAVGMYGVISYLVAHRRSEIGVRVALGARTPQVAWLVLGQSLRLAIGGVVLGLAVAFLATRLLRSLLFEVSPTDPIVLAGAAAVLVFIAAVASLAPMWRALKIAPVEAMRGS